MGARIRQAKNELKDLTYEKEFFPHYYDEFVALNRDWHDFERLYYNGEQTGGR